LIFSKAFVFSELERAMGIEQIRMNQTKALSPVPQFNWSQIEPSYAKSYDSPVAGVTTARELHQASSNYYYDAIF
jgi:hypothetical protein